MARNLALLVLALLVGFWLGRWNPHQQTSPAEAPAAGPKEAPTGARPQALPAVQVTLAQAKAGTLKASRQVGGVVVPYLQVNVLAQVGGVVAQVLKKAGGRVAKGEVVVRLDATALEIALKNAQAALRTAEVNLAAQTRASQEARARLEAQLRQAEAAYQAAQKAYEAAQRVHALGGLSEAELKQAEAQLYQAQANLDAARTALAQNDRAQEETLATLRVAVEQAQNQVAQAQLNLQNAALRAPFAGEILAVTAVPGAYLGVGATAFTLAQDRRVQFGVPPEEAPLLPKGSRVDFAYGGRTYPAEVEQNPGGTSSGGMVTLTARLLQETDLPLGTTGTVAYTATLAQGVLVPVGALQSDGTVLYVFAVSEGRARRTPVRLLAQSGEQAAVEGLTPGTEVVVNPPPGLLDGTPVREGGSSRQEPGAPLGQRGNPSSSRPRPGSNPGR